MKFRTEIALPVSSVKLDYKQPLLLLGSCFSEAIGSRLRASLFDCVVNPFGILFNPHSILYALRRMYANRLFESHELSEKDGYWYSLMHHGRFSTASSDQTLNAINNEFRKGAMQLASPCTLLLTFGTSYFYTCRDTGEVVANCHKLPSSYFEKQRLTVEEIVEGYSTFFSTWFQEDARRKVIFTVSPIRHLRDGLHENQLSKSILLLSIDALMQRFPDRIHYFPAYEIVLDELRDYRFYDRDMLHPTDLTEDYIYECFATHFFSEETISTARRIQEYIRMKNHRLLHPFSEEAQRFKAALDSKREELLTSFPFLSPRLSAFMSEQI